MSDAYNALGAAPADSPLPTTITPEMAQALQSYQGGPGGNLLARAGHALFDEPLAALRGQMTENEAQDFAVRTALGTIGPMGAGKVAGVAAGMVPLLKSGAKTLEQRVADLAASAGVKSIAEQTSAHFPMDEVEKALGGWDETAMMPAHGSDWQALNFDPLTSKIQPSDVDHAPSSEPGDYFITAKGHKIADLTQNSEGSGYFLEMPNGASKHVNSIDEGKGLALGFHNNSVSYPSSKLKPSYVAPAKPLEDSDIDSALAANPGASIFDLAGVSRPTPKIMPADEIGMKAAANTATLPHEATWQLPDAAKAQGYNVAVHHGTRTPTIFDQFALPENGELGVHFGSPRAAQEIQGSTLNAQDAPRVYPTAVVAQNPLRLKDSGTWYPGDVARNLIKNGGFDPEEVNYARYAGIDTDKMTVGQRSSYMDSPEVLQKQAQNLRNLIQSKGHDSVVYQNTVEDKGHDSYVLFRESPQAPGHVYGARLPWADFDPAKFTSASIKAGIPLGAATGAYMSDQGGKLHPLEDASSSPHAQAAFPEDTAQ